MVVEMDDIGGLIKDSFYRFDFISQSHSFGHFHIVEVLSQSAESLSIFIGFLELARPVAPYPASPSLESQSKVVLSESSGIEWYRVTSSDGYIIDEAIHE
jgi:hypothetical protein